jgi:glycerol-3-phosphate acyltransferase PlsY
MQNLMDAGVVLLAYVFGSIPFGLLIVKLMTGRTSAMLRAGERGHQRAESGRLFRRTADRPV